MFIEKLDSKQDLFALCVDQGVDQKNENKKEFRALTYELLYELFEEKVIKDFEEEFTKYLLEYRQGELPIILHINNDVDTVKKKLAKYKINE